MKCVNLSTFMAHYDVKSSSSSSHVMLLAGGAKVLMVSIKITLRMKASIIFKTNLQTYQKVLITVELYSESGENRAPALNSSVRTDVFMFWRMLSADQASAKC